MAGQSHNSPSPSSQHNTLMAIASGFECLQNFEMEPYFRYTRLDCTALVTADAIPAKIRGVLANAYIAQTGTEPSMKALNVVVETVLERCGASIPTQVPYRLCRAMVERETVLCLDLGSHEWGAVIVSPSRGVQYTPLSPIPFRRPEGTKPLPIPTPDPHGRGVMDLLQEYAPLPTEEQQVLRLGFMLCCLWPVGPYPILSLTGPPESGKGYHARLIRETVDPVYAPFQGIPANERDLLLDCYQERVPVLDNISRLPGWGANALCRISTGASLKKKRMYADKARISVKVCNPLMVTSIGRVLTHADLVSRSIILELPRVPDKGRWDETDRLEEYEGVLPYVLHGLLVIIQSTLKRYPTAMEEEQSRLTPLFRLMGVAERELGWGPGTFLRAYTKNRSLGHDSILDEIPYIIAIRDIVKEAEMGAKAGTPAPYWEGTSGELMRMLKDRVAPSLRGDDWPTSEKDLTNQLRDIAPSLEDLGFRFTYNVRHTRLGRLHRLQRRREEDEEQ